MRLAPGEVLELGRDRRDARARRGRLVRNVLVVAGGLALVWLVGWAHAAP